MSQIEDDNFEMTLEEGSHQYPFSFLLPVNAPSSFCHKYGHVKYLLEATVTRNRKSNYVSKAPFSVNGVLDLNTEPEAAKEAETSIEKVHRPRQQFDFMTFTHSKFSH